MLIKAGANLELVDGINDTALTKGAFVGALEVVEALLRAGADASHKGYNGRTAAEWAQ
jgi:ankyrin repeat protein